MSELKPCPFCGGEMLLPTIKEFSNAIICSKCGVQISGYRISDLAEKWNRRASGWISVEDRLPEIGEMVLVYYPSGKVSTNKILWDDEDGRWWLTGDLDPGHTHWQPLPEPPK